jgi:hypothetical protein
MLPAHLLLHGGRILSHCRRRGLRCRARVPPPCPPHASTTASAALGQIPQRQRGSGDAPVDVKHSPHASLPGALPPHALPPATVLEDTLLGLLERYKYPAGHLRGEWRLRGRGCCGDATDPFACMSLGRCCFSILSESTAAA